FRGVASLGGRSYCNVPIGQHAFQFFAVADGYNTDVEMLHLCRRLFQDGLAVDDFDIKGHYFSELHNHLPRVLQTYFAQVMCQEKERQEKGEFLSSFSMDNRKR